MKNIKVLLSIILVSAFVSACGSNDSQTENEITAMEKTAEEVNSNTFEDGTIEVVYSEPIINEEETLSNFPLADTIQKYSEPGIAGGVLSRRMGEYAKAVSENLVNDATVLHFKEGIVVALDHGSVYNSGQYLLSENAKTALRKLAYNLHQMPDTYVLVAGRTDNVGNESSNDKLAYRRAAIAANYLKGCGINESRFLIDSYGEKYPDYQNTSRINKDRNRRVDFLIIPSNEMRKEAAA